MTNTSIPTKQKIKNFKNFVSLDKSLKKWLTTCPREYIWTIDEVTEDLESKERGYTTPYMKGTFTFRKINKNFEL
tara:strand:- start:19 stop:243 length:225 start_codon:yes stop_codon:yes gene_type:complete